VVNPAGKPGNPATRKSPGEEQFRVFIETVRDYALLILDPQGHITTWNAGAEAIKGYKADEIVGRHFSRFYPEESIAAGLPERELEDAIREGRYEDEGWRVRKDGSRFWANVVLTALRDGDGKLIGFAKVTRDLTERRRHEESLRQNETRFRALIEGVRDYAIFMLDEEGCVATWNAGAQQIMGYTTDEILGTHLSRLYPPGPRREELAERELTTATLEGRFEDEDWRVRKDGSRFWANVVLTAIRDSTGRLLGFSKITRDLTERRKYETHLRESEERFRLLVESVVDYAIITVAADGFIASWNNGAERITGYTATEIVGRHFSRLYPPEDVTEHKPWRQLIAAREQGRVSEEGWRLRKDGTQFWANSVIAKLPGIEAAPHFYIVTQDLTQRRHAESLADTAQKMHEFIAMLAHELRNPLAPIRNAVALMQRRKIEDPIVESMCQTIDRQSAQLVRIIDELLDVNRVARGQFSIERAVIDLRDVIVRAMETSRPAIDAKNHSLTVDLGAQEIRVDADALRMTQVVVNLLNNAAKYTPPGGRLELQAMVVDELAEIHVRDNGKGIDREAIDRIFDLFIQLEPNSLGSMGGLGVGLALVRRIVELHGGRVQARSEGVGRGSEFIVRIPISHAAPIGHQAHAEHPDAEQALRILVVDDNVDAADSLALLLQQLGHRVQIAYDGATALRAVTANPPHLLLLDIGMPHMSGYDVARAIRGMQLARQPLIAAVTGWGQPGDRERAREAGFDRHFAKPVSEQDIRRLLTDVAEARSPRPN
jgi:PAS domain S-box-containing protein